jgi:hypothetical protein
MPCCDVGLDTAGRLRKGIVVHGILPQVVHDYLNELWTTLKFDWDQFWFQSTDPVTIGAIRCCTGLVLLYSYLSCTPQVLSFVSPDGWIDNQAIRELRAAGLTESSLFGQVSKGWWSQSIWFYVQDARLIWTIHGLFLSAIICFTIGFMSRVSNIIVWAGHLSFIARSYVAWYGLDVVLAMLTFYLMFGPTGRAFAVDSLIRRRRAVKTSQGTEGQPDPAPSWSANVVIRLIQIHICIIYLCSGLSKLQGEMWWNGTAIWQVVMTQDMVPFDLRWLATLPDWALALLFEPAAALTVAFEISFTFLIWNRLLRPLLLMGAVLLHLGIGLLVGLDAFSAAMLTGCLAFVPAHCIRIAVDRRRR